MVAERKLPCAKEKRIIKQYKYNKMSYTQQKSAWAQKRLEGKKGMGMYANPKAFCVACFNLSTFGINSVPHECKNTK